VWKFQQIQVTEAGSITEPVTVDDVKEWIGGLGSSTDFDDLLASMITPAREDIENYIDAKLVDSTVNLYVDSTSEDDEITSLPKVFSIPDTLTITKIVKGQTPENVVLDEGYYLNGSLTFYNTGKYNVEYEITGEVPDTIKEAIKMLIAYRFNNRGDQQLQQGIPDDIKAKIDKYQLISI
jgi:hypothetical protein